jgi:predicted GH43/DUF377 family glycosyl hydrolase
MACSIERLPLHLVADPRRVITRFFSPGDVNRIRGILTRALAIPETEVAATFQKLLETFQSVHRDIRAVFDEHYKLVKQYLPESGPISEDRSSLIGACFTMEYALESVALFNPSMVPALKQDGEQAGGTRFLMSLRATGEGHLSSIVFRRGTIDGKGNVAIDPPDRYSRQLKAKVPGVFDKARFQRDLLFVHSMNKHLERILSLLNDRFTLEDLAAAIQIARPADDSLATFEEAADTLISLTRVNHQLEMPEEGLTSELVIFPFSDIERHGVEDLRLVRFTEDNGSQCLYGTYTAYNGLRVFPQLLEYRGGPTIEVSLITGRGAQNKGMALFPRRINGQYAMVSRVDNENLYYMESPDVRLWDEARLLQCPKFPWEIIQIGNCGSPLETEAGWLLLTHGVGPMRQYCIGASLLDLHEPWRVIGQSREPLLIPSDDERAGYVPNVVYSCGAMIHDGMLFLPYGMSDLSTGMVKIPVGEILKCL